MSKFSVAPIIKAHLKTLRHADEDRPRVADYVQLYAFPIVLAAVGWISGFRIGAVGEMLAGITVLASLLFALVIFVIQLRLQMTTDPRVSLRATRLVDELFANVCYAVLVGLASTTVTLIAAATRTSDGKDPDPDPLSPLWTAAVVVTAAHLLLMVLMSLKRTNATYRELSKYRPAKPEAREAPPCSRHDDALG